MIPRAVAANLSLFQRGLMRCPAQSASRTRWGSKSRPYEGGKATLSVPTCRCGIPGINLTRDLHPMRLYEAMRNVAVAYIRNHRRQLQMLASGVLVSSMLAFGESNERALFAATPASVSAALAAVVDSDQFSVGSPRITPAAFFARRRTAGSSPDLAQSTSPIPPLVLALTDPGGLDPLTDLPPGAADGLGLPGTQPRGFQGRPLAGSSPAGAGAAAPPDTIPAVPEPGTWIMMIVGFFVVGSSFRIGRRYQSVQLERVARKAD